MGWSKSKRHEYRIGDTVKTNKKCWFRIHGDSIPEYINSPIKQGYDVSEMVNANTQGEIIGKCKDWYHIKFNKHVIIVDVLIGRDNNFSLLSLKD